MSICTYSPLCLVNRYIMGFSHYHVFPNGDESSIPIFVMHDFTPLIFFLLILLSQLERTWMFVIRILPEEAFPESACRISL